MRVAGMSGLLRCIRTSLFAIVAIRNTQKEKDAVRYVIIHQASPAIRTSGDKKLPFVRRVSLAELDVRRLRVSVC